ncbi:NUDIX hydrolase [Rhizobium tibeticum]|uniref:NUDIX hydrolase n=1 Tax=Rhizobium tibeticum TaxID=501024 RepID=UPI0027D7A2F1|nr:NUDIX hydrolase [Rhizobium tibeticum]
MLHRFIKASYVSSSMMKAMLEEEHRTGAGASPFARDVRQAGAICYRRNKNGDLRILLVGSRRNGRWGVPKGHLDPGETTAAAALREAFEEAGVEGSVDPDVFGSFSYRKEVHPIGIRSRFICSRSPAWRRSSLKRQCGSRSGSRSRLPFETSPSRGCGRSFNACDRHQASQGKAREAETHSRSVTTRHLATNVPNL